MKCPLPLTMKLEAIRQVALSKVQHLISNVHIQQKVLSEMNNKTVSLVRKRFGLNTHSTRKIIFHYKWEGGLGGTNVIWIYASEWVDLIFPVPGLTRESEPHFLVYKRKPSRNLTSNPLVLVSGQIGRIWTTFVFELEYHWSGCGLIVGLWESPRIFLLTPRPTSGQQPHTVVTDTC